MLLQKIQSSLILKSQNQGTLDLPGNKRAYKTFLVEGSKIHLFHTYLSHTHHSFHFSKSLHLHMDNMATFSYTTKIGKVQNNALAYQTKQIQDYSISKGIINIIEYLLHICELTHIELGVTHILPGNIFCLISPAFVLCHSR